MINEAKKMCPLKVNFHTLGCNLQSRKFYAKQGFIEGEKSIHPKYDDINIWHHWQASGKAKIEKYNLMNLCEMRA